MYYKLLICQASKLIAISFDHYRYGIRQKLLRYKQLLLIVTLLLFPTVGALYNTTVKPLHVLFAQPALFSQTVGIVVGYQILDVLWARLQRDAIFCDSISSFLSSLPIQYLAFLIRDVAILLLSSSLLFIPLTAAFYEHSVSHRFSWPSTVVFFFIVSSATISQLVFLYRWRIGYLLILISTLLFAKLLSSPNGLSVSGIGLCLLLLLFALYGAYFRIDAPSTVQIKNTRHRMNKRHRVTKASAIGAVVRLNLRALYAAKASGYWLTVVASIALSTFASALVIAKQGKVEPLMICVLAAIMSALFSMSYATLFAQRKRYEAMLFSLPLNRIQWLISDIVTVQGLPFCLTMIPTALWCWLAAFSTFSLILPPVSVLIVGAIHYPIYQYRSKHAIVLSLLTLIAWAFVCYALNSLLKGKLNG